MSLTIQDPLPSGNKRFRSEEKISQQENCPIMILSKDIFLYMLNTLRARDLKNFGKTCKIFKLLTEDAPMWKKIFLKMNDLGSNIESEGTFKQSFKKALKEKDLTAILSKVYFECENEYAKTNIPKAIELVDFLIECEPEDDLLCKALLKKAELLAAKKPVIEERCETIKDLADEILQKPTSKTEKAHIHYLKAKMAPYLDPNLSIKKHFKQLKAAYFDPDTPLQSKIEAEIETCSMILNDAVVTFSKEETLECFENLFHNDENDATKKALKLTRYYSKCDDKKAAKPFVIISELGLLEKPVRDLEAKALSFLKAKAVKRLEEILHDEKATIEQRALATLYVAKEFYKKNSKECDEKAANSFFQVANDLDVSITTRTTAAFHLAVMRFDNRTSLISDEQAVKYLMKIIKLQETEFAIKDEAYLHLAKFRCENRTDLIKDYTAFLCLDKVNKNKFINEYLKNEATLYQAIMRYEGRTNQITDTKAIQFLRGIVNDPGFLTPKLDLKATLYLALFLHRSGRKKNKASELFELVASDELAEENDRKKAKECLKMI